MTELALQPHRQVPNSGDLEVRGLLHDLGHQMMTLSLLAEAVRDDSALSADSRQRMDLVMQEMFRIVDIIADCRTTGAAAGAPGDASVIDIRQLADEVAQLAGLAYETRVTVQPGRTAMLRVRATLLWRVLANLVDNAVRAAGPADASTSALSRNGTQSSRSWTTAPDSAAARAGRPESALPSCGSCWRLTAPGSSSARHPVAVPGRASSSACSGSTGPLRCPPGPGTDRHPPNYSKNHLSWPVADLVPDLSGRFCDPAHTGRVD